MKTYTFVGINHVEGSKHGKSYCFDTAYFLGDFAPNQNASGKCTFSASVPIDYTAILNKENVGKKVDMTTFFMGGKTYIAYVALCK